MFLWIYPKFSPVQFLKQQIINFVFLKPLVSRDKAVFHASIIRRTFSSHADRTRSFSCEELSDPEEHRLLKWLAMSCQSWLQDFSLQNSNYRVFTEQHSRSCHQRLTTWSTLRTSWQAPWHRRVPWQSDVTLVRWCWCCSGGTNLQVKNNSLGSCLAPATACVCVWTQTGREVAYQ